MIDYEIQINMYKKCIPGINTNFDYIVYFDLKNHCRILTKSKYKSQWHITTK